MGGNRSRKSENRKKSGYNATENRKSKNGTENRKTEMWLQWEIFRFSDFRPRFSENRVCGYNERFSAPIFGKPEIFSDRIFRSDFFIGFRFFETC